MSPFEELMTLTGSKRVHVHVFPDKRRQLLDDWAEAILMDWERDSAIEAARRTRRDARRLPVSITLGKKS